MEQLSDGQKKKGLKFCIETDSVHDATWFLWGCIMHGVSFNAKF